jgi:hypothetical protein
MIDLEVMVTLATVAAALGVVKHRLNRFRKECDRRDEPADRTDD